MQIRIAQGRAWFQLRAWTGLCRRVEQQSAGSRESGLGIAITTVLVLEHLNEPVNLAAHFPKHSLLRGLPHLAGQRHNSARASHLQLGLPLLLPVLVLVYTR